MSSAGWRRRAREWGTGATYSETLIALDERYEDAGGHRILGRLHTLAPKVPFVTGWVDHGKAVSELRRAVALGPDNLDNHALPRRGALRVPAGQGGRGARDPAPRCSPARRSPSWPSSRRGASPTPGRCSPSIPADLRRADELRAPRPRIAPSQAPLVAVAAAAFLVALKGGGRLAHRLAGPGLGGARLGGRPLRLRRQLPGAAAQRPPARRGPRLRPRQVRESGGPRPGAVPGRRRRQPGRGPACGA